MKKLAAVFLALLLGAPVFAVDARVGSIQSFSGDVRIDAFGKGAFVAAARGDTLYASSVVKTGANGRVSLELQGNAQAIAPGSTVRIAELLAASVKKNGLGWFAAVGKLLKSIAGSDARKEGDLVLGSRADEASSEYATTDWMVDETDAKEALPGARVNIDSGNYAAALSDLLKADPPADPSVAWDLAFWKGFCYYQLGDFGDAASRFADARVVEQSSKTPSVRPEDRGALLYLWGSSLYFVGREKEAVSPLDAYAGGYADGAFAPYAALLLSKSLAIAGDPARARTVAADGARRWKGTGLEADFSALLK